MDDARLQAEAILYHIDRHNSCISKQPVYVHSLSVFFDTLKRGFVYEGVVITGWRFQSFTRRHVLYRVPAAPRQRTDLLFKKKWMAKMGWGVPPTWAHLTSRRLKCGSPWFPWDVIIRYYKIIIVIILYMAMCQNLVPLVNIKIAGKWMFIPLKMVLIGIDP